MEKKNASASRRQFLSNAALVAAALKAGTVNGQMMMPEQGHSMPQHLKMGVLGTESAGENRPIIGMLAYPKMVLQDFVGPLTVFNLIHSEIHIVWKTLDPVMTETGLTVQPSTLLDDCPEVLDVLFVPGGLDGSIDMMTDTQVLDFLADRGSRARFVTSDCTGALVLGAAGLLQGYKATGHWYIRDQLALMGAIPVHDRVVQDRNRITGGGVTAGLDFGLTLASLLRDEDRAKWVQLIIEYAPSPPYNSGLPETAEIYERLLSVRSPAITRSEVLAKEIGNKIKINT